MSDSDDEYVLDDCYDDFDGFNPRCMGYNHVCLLAPCKS